MPVLDEQIEMLDQATALELRGRVVEVQGLALRVAAMPTPVGAMVRVHTQRGAGPIVDGEVVGLDGEHAIVMPLGSTNGIGRGDRVVAGEPAQAVRTGDALLGRVLDGLGNPIDGKGPLRDTTRRPLHPKNPGALSRPPIDEPLATGVRAVDTMMSLGRGQRIGIFAGPGCGKSTLMGMMAKHTAADVSVIALVGERAREVRDFIEKTLGVEGLKRAVVVVATGDEPALLRQRCAWVASAIAEQFRDQGRDVLLLMDSVTRFCQAQRQIGLAAGEPPATKGYPPSVFSLLPSLLERSGRTKQGSITGLYAVLVEGDDMTEPIADACRGVLDGHILLDRRLAEKGHFPAIDVLGSISRVADDVTTKQHQAARRETIKALASYRDVEDLLNIGAYAAGTNPDYDVAIAGKPAIDQLLQQGRGEVTGQAQFPQASAQLAALAQHLSQARQQATAQTGNRRGPQGPR